MWDFKFSTIIALMIKTFPFLVFRFLVFTSITLIAVALTGGGAGLGWMGGAIMGEPEGGVFYGGLAGAGAAAYFLYFIREYVLYQVKAGHIALLVKFMDGHPVPEGQGMVVYAKDQVKARFKESNVLFAVDQLIKGVLKVIAGMFNSVAHLIPVPGLAGFIKLVNKIVSMSLTYVDEIILAYHMKNGTENVWTESTKALVLYAQNYGKMLKNAFWVSLLVWVLTIVVFFIVLAPFAALVAAVPSLAGFWTFVVAALLAWGIKSAVIDPIAMTALMQVYFKTIEGQNPDLEWERKLIQLSDKFRTMKEKGQSLAAATFKPFFRKTSEAV